MTSLCRSFWWSLKVPIMLMSTMIEPVMRSHSRESRTSKRPKCKWMSPRNLQAILFRTVIYERSQSFAVVHVSSVQCCCRRIFIGLFLLFLSLDSFSPRQKESKTRTLFHQASCIYHRRSCFFFYFFFYFFPLLVFWKAQFNVQLQNNVGFLLLLLLFAYLPLAVWNLCGGLNLFWNYIDMCEFFFVFLNKWKKQQKVHASSSRGDDGDSDRIDPYVNTVC